MAVAADVPVQPYTLIEVSTQWDEQGRAKEEYRMLRAVNSAGASVTQDLSKEAGGLRQIQQGGFNTLVDPIRRSAVTGARPVPPYTPPAACVDRYRFPNPETKIEVRPNSERVGGLTVDRITIRSRDRRSEWYLAPALDCVLLRNETYVGERLIRKFEATDIRLGEPDPKLFEVPMDYTYTRVSREMK